MAEAITSTLTSRLRELARLKEEKDRATHRAKACEAEYKTLEAEIIEEMLYGDPQHQMRSVKLEDIGVFTVRGRDYFKISNLPAMLQWAERESLVSGLVFRDNVVNIPFEMHLHQDDNDAVTGELSNGILRADVKRTPLAEHIKESTANGHPSPPGVDPSTTLYITLRRSS